MKDRIVQLIRCRKGAALALVVVSMLAVASAAAIAIDIGMLVSARTDAQRAADSAALAGASAFIDDPTNAPTLAPDRAKEYAEEHNVGTRAVSLVPAEDVQVIVDERRVRVTVRNIQARGNPMNTFFARVFGVGTVDIQAVAMAEAIPADAVGCLTPWAVGDWWQDTWAGGDPGPYDYDDADKSDTPTPGDEFDNYCPCDRNDDGDVIIEASYPYIGLVCDPALSGDKCTGYGSDLRNGDGGGYINDVGRQLTLKPGNPAQSWSPGWFMAWRPPDNMGGADYRENIINCIDETMFDTGSIVPIDSEQGNMIGPTIQGVEERIGDDPHYWEPGCTTGTDCIRSTTSDCGVGDNGECAGYDRRMVTVPLMDPTEVMRNGLTEIQFRGFMRLFLDDPSGNDITGHILGLGGAGAGGIDVDSGALPLYLRLVE